jgi:hypothetical protein
MEPEISVYIPPLWLHNRVIVRKKGTQGPEFVLRALRCGSSREDTTIEIIPVESCNVSRTEYDSVAILSVGDVEDNYESTGRTMSITRAPL